MKKSILVNTDELTNYIKDLRKIPVITHERQEVIFSLLNNKKTTKEDKKKFYYTNINFNMCFRIFKSERVYA